MALGQVYPGPAVLHRRGWRFYVGFLFSAGLCLLVIYFLWYAISGPSGYLQLRVAEQQLLERQQYYASLTQRYQLLVDRTAQLREDSLEKDALEGHVRRVLGWIAPNEIILLTPKVSAEDIR